MSRLKRTCSVEGCSNLHHAKGLCIEHYRTQNADTIRKQQADYRKRPEVKQRKTEYRAQNTNAIRQYQADYQRRPEVKQRNLRRMVEYYAQNTEVIKQRKAEYTRTPAGRAARINKRVRTSYPDTPGEVTVEHVAALMKIADCPCCGQPFGKGKRTLHFDHILPLSRGGTNYDDNLQVLCAECNKTKHNRTEAEFTEYILRLASRRTRRS